MFTSERMAAIRKARDMERKSPELTGLCVEQVQKQFLSLEAAFGAFELIYLRTQHEAVNKEMDGVNIRQSLLKSTNPMGIERDD